MISRTLKFETLAEIIAKDKDNKCFKVAWLVGSVGLFLLIEGEMGIYCSGQVEGCNCWTTDLSDTLCCYVGFMGNYVAT